MRVYTHTTTIEAISLEHIIFKGLFCFAHFSSFKTHNNCTRWHFNSHFIGEETEA